MLIASTAAAMDGETALFLTSDSVNLAVKGSVDGLGADGYPALSDLFASYRENGGQIWVCPACAGARGITESDLVDGAEIAGAARTIGFVNDGARVLA
jgi:predicted peroxiredoxin